MKPINIVIKRDKGLNGDTDDREWKIGEKIVMG